jgi:hypothetical protein
MPITQCSQKPGVRAACRQSSSASGVLVSPVKRSSTPGLRLHNRSQQLKRYETQNHE